MSLSREQRKSDRRPRRRDPKTGILLGKRNPRPKSKRASDRMFGHQPVKGQALVIRDRGTERILDMMTLDHAREAAR